MFEKWELTEAATMEDLKESVKMFADADCKVCYGRGWVGILYTPDKREQLQSCACFRRNVEPVIRAQEIKEAKEKIN